MCPFGSVQDLKKLIEESKTIGKSPNNSQEIVASLTKAHFISTPMLLTCCGQSACYNCLKENFVSQMKSFHENESGTITIKCPFCKKEHQMKTPKVLSEETKIGEVTWSELREEAMKSGFDTTEQYQKFNTEEQKLVELLIQAQQKQGDNEVLQIQLIKNELI